MSREYYIYSYRLDRETRYLIWHTDNGDEADGVVCNAQRKMRVFRTERDLLIFAQTQNYVPVNNGMEPLALKTVARWLRHTSGETVDCPVFLNAWNLLGDVSVSVGGNFDANKRQTKKIYQKLFWGNNLPSITPKGKHYEPTWTLRELKIIRRVLRYGLRLFRSKLCFA